MILDRQATIEAANEGMAAADLASTDTWRELMYNAIVRVAHKLKYFTVDDVWVEASTISDINITLKDSLGPVMRRVYKDGLVEKTGNFKRSDRPSTHGKPQVVWASLVVRV